MGLVTSCAEIACCAGMASCSAFSCCNKLVSGSGTTRGPYIAILVINATMGLLTKYYLTPYLDHLSYWRAGCEPNGAGDGYAEDGHNSDYSKSDLHGSRLEFFNACLENTAIYRAAFAMAMLFALMTVLTAVSWRAQKGFWAPKVALWLVTYAVTFFIPSYVFTTFAWIALVVSILFLLLQAVVLLDLAYEWNASWADKAASEEDGKKWLGALLVCSLGLYAAWLTFVSLSFKDFDCGAPKAITALVLVLALLYTPVQLFAVEDGSLMTSAIVTAYAGFLCWSAVNDEPDAACNPNLEDESWFTVTVGVALAVLSLAYTAFSASSAVPSLFHTEDNGDLNTKLIDDVVTTDKSDSTLDVPDPESGNAGRKASGGGDDDQEPASPYWTFQLVMLVASLYFAMLATSWGSLTTAANAANPTAGRTSMWVKGASAWLSQLLYFWTLVAPKLFPDRDFS